MGKLDEMRQAASLGGRPGAFPPGMDPSQAVGRPARMEGVRGDRSAARIAVDRIERDPDQPREEFDPEALERLAESLRTRGQLQPIRVRWDEGRGVYVVIAGERRWRAARMAGLPELLCVIHDGDLGARERLAVQLIENALREDLRPVEAARAYRRLMEAEGWSLTQLARELAVSPAGVSKTLALLDLPEAVQGAVDDGELPASVAYEVSKLDDAAAQAEVAQAVVEQGLRREEVAEIVRAVRAKRPTPAARPEPVTIDLGDGTTVRIAWRKANGVDPIKALRRALKAMQEKGPEGEAA